LTKRRQPSLRPIRLARRRPFGHRPSLSGVPPCALRQAPSHQIPRGGPQPNGSGPWANGDGDATFELPASTPTCRRYSDCRPSQSGDRSPPDGARCPGGVPCLDRTALRSCRRRSWARRSANLRSGGPRWSELEVEDDEGLSQLRPGIPHGRHLPGSAGLMARPGPLGDAGYGLVCCSIVRGFFPPGMGFLLRVDPGPGLAWSVHLFLRLALGHLSPEPVPAQTPASVRPGKA
jgi:hypothetical protein